MNPSPNDQITDSAIPAPKSGCQLEEFDDELVLYDMDTTQAIYLNETAALVLRLCDGKRTVADICTLIKEAYPESADIIESDIHTTLTRLSDAGTVTLS